MENRDKHCSASKQQTLPVVYREGVTLTQLLPQAQPASGSGTQTEQSAPRNSCQITEGMLGATLSLIDLAKAFACAKQAGLDGAVGATERIGDLLRAAPLIHV